MSNAYILERWRRGMVVLARRLDRMSQAAQAANNWTVTGNALYQNSAEGHSLHIQGPATPFPWGSISFGFSRAGGNFTVKTGTVFRGRSFVTIADTVVPVSGGTAESPHYVYMRFPVSDLTSAEIPLVPLASMPTPNDTYWQVPLYACYYNGATIVVVQYHNFGNIYVPGQFDD